MAGQTKIEWCDSTWNPFMGCRKVSEGCKNCYMFRDMTFYGRDPNKVVRAADASFRNPLKWARNNKLTAGARIFTCSWSDWFIKEADDWRDEAWWIISQTPEFTYIILTKRPERIVEHLPKDWGEGYPNVWLLVSAENQKWFDERWQILSGIPAVIRGISAEPLLSKIDMFQASIAPDWVITGGESGRLPRVSDLEWFRKIRNFCAVHRIPYFHKQHGGSRKINGAWGGRELDGRTWDEFPGAK